MKSLVLLLLVISVPAFAVQFKECNGANMQKDVYIYGYASKAARDKAAEQITKLSGVSKVERLGDTNLVVSVDSAKDREHTMADLKSMVKLPGTKYVDCNYIMHANDGALEKSPETAK